ncbi:amidohydrolase family protein [Stieleria varia]|nr:amidohydrolase family protein [Stieleria varia]
MKKSAFRLGNVLLDLLADLRPAVITAAVTTVTMIGCLSAAHGQDPGVARPAATHPNVTTNDPSAWRAERRIVDVHTHVSPTADRYTRAVRILDEVGVGIAIELGSGTVTPPQNDPNGRSALERAMSLSEEIAPGRFMHHMLIDYSGWDSPDWSVRAAAQVQRGHELGAAGLKEFKRLGLFLRDGNGELIRVDDPKLDAVWAKCGELKMPVSIHVADPKAFWLPRDETNERWAELRDHPNWWFGDPKRYPKREELLEQLSRVMERHPETTFIAVHFANNAEEIDWVDEQLDRHPNLFADIAARIPEIGRHPPEKLRALFIKHQDRLLFGTDFQTHQRLILGSAGDDERPSDYDAVVFYEKSWRFFETADRNWPHMTPIQGDWTISSINLPTDVLRKVYFDNARRLFVRRFPLPTLRAKLIESDFVPDGKLDDEVWQTTQPARIEYTIDRATPMPNISTQVRVLCSPKYLYLGFVAPYTQLQMGPDDATGERFGLWEDDVVEAFIAPDPSTINHYTEYEWAPNGETLDLKLKLPEKDFQWSSEMQSAVKLDNEQKIWTTEVRIPIEKITSKVPTAGDRWRVNFYRHDNAANAFLGWSPTATRTAHEPQKFGWLEFTK